MAGSVRFKVEVFISNPDLFPELVERTRDLRPAFDVIVRKWAQTNEDKFRRAVGAEEGGASIDPTVFWEALRPSTIRQKRKLGFGNQIMVRTGQLEKALTDPEGFFHEMTAEEAVFGTPNSEEDELKARFNWKKRQTIFLSVDDQRMIQATIKNYFELGGDFERIMFSKGLQNLRDRGEMAAMDLAFENTTGGS